MPRKPSLDPPTALNLRLPESDRAWLDLHLWSEIDGRVPVGAYQKFFLARLAEYKEWETLGLEPFGLPQGFFIRGPKEVLAALERVLILEDD